MSARRWSVEDRHHHHHDYAIEEVVSPQKGATTSRRLFSRINRRRLQDDDDAGIDEVPSPQKTRPEVGQRNLTSFLEDVEIIYSEEIVHSTKRVRLTSTPEVVDEEFNIEEVFTQYIELPTPKEIPYHIRNTLTFKKQLEKCLPLIEVDIVICHVWRANSDGHWQALVKDSNGFISVVESTIRQGKLLPAPSLGQRYRLEGLVVLQRITTAISTVLFSVFDTIGHLQHSYLRLGVTPDTKWTEFSAEIIQIPYEETDDGTRKLLKELEKLKYSSLRNGLIPSFLKVNSPEGPLSSPPSQVNVKFYIRNKVETMGCWE